MARRPPWTWRLVALAFGVAAILAAIYMSGPQRIWDALARADPLPLVPAVLTEAAAIALLGIAWRSLLKGMSMNPGMGDSVKATSLEVFVDAALPTASVGGELLRITYARNKMGIPIGGSLAAAISLRFTIAAVLAVAILLASPIVMAHVVDLWALAAVLLALAAAMAAVAAVPRRLAAAIPGRIRGFAEGVLVYASASLRSKYTALAFAAVGAEIVSSATTQALAFVAMRAAVPYYMALAVYPVYDFLLSLPTGIPGSIGVADVGTSLVYAAIGVPWPTALATMIVVRILSLGVDAALGAPVLVLESAHLAIPPEVKTLISMEAIRRAIGLGSGDGA